MAMSFEPRPADRRAYADVGGELWTAHYGNYRLVSRSLLWLCHESLAAIFGGLVPSGAGGENVDGGRCQRQVRGGEFVVYVVSARGMVGKVAPLIVTRTKRSTSRVRLGATLTVKGWRRCSPGGITGKG